MGKGRMKAPIKQGRVSREQDDPSVGVWNGFETLTT
jgi:hypothetical protein